MKLTTRSDPLSEDGQSIECPWCSEFISEELDDVEPDCRGTEITCPGCSNEVTVILEVLHQYTARPARPAQSDGKLTLDKAIETRSCRICGEKMSTSGSPKEFWLQKWTFNFGKEFAHTKCLEKKDEAVVESRGINATGVYRFWGL